MGTGTALAGSLLKRRKQSPSGQSPSGANAGFSSRPSDPTHRSWAKAHPWAKPCPGAHVGRGMHARSPLPELSQRHRLQTPVAQGASVLALLTFWIESCLGGCSVRHGVFSSIAGHQGATHTPRDIQTVPDANTLRGAPCPRLGSHALRPAGTGISWCHTGPTSLCVPVPVEGKPGSWLNSSAALKGSVTSREVSLRVPR